MKKFMAGFRHFFLLEKDYDVIDNQFIAIDASDRRDIAKEIAKFNVFRIIPLSLIMLVIDAIMFGLDYFGLTGNVTNTIIPLWWFFVGEGFLFLWCFIYLFVSRGLLRRKTVTTASLVGVYRSFWFFYLVALSGIFLLNGISHGSFDVPIIIFVLTGIFPILGFAESIVYLLIPALTVGGAVIYGYISGVQLIAPLTAGLNVAFYFFLGLVIARIMNNTSLSLVYSKKRTEKSKDKLQVQSETDPLTGLSNRLGLERVTNHLWAADKEKPVMMGVAILDIDFFKSFNDTYGHERGDFVIASIAKCMRAVLQSKCDSLARIGGEEFVIVCSCLNNVKFMKLLGELQAKVHDLGIIAGNQTVNKFVTVSIGVSLPGPITDKKWLDFYVKADKALYEAKTTGRNKICSTQKDPTRKS